MFTGIITAVSAIEKKIELSSGIRIILKNPYDDVQLGESIAVNGACLTVESISHGLQFFVSKETLEKTNLGNIATDDLANLERALLVSNRFSGHFVQGHVDGKAKITSIQPVGDAFEICIQIPDALKRFIVEKGSITLDGISLTVNSIKETAVYLMVIPHTWKSTHLHSKHVGQDLNLEVDVIARYIEKLYAHHFRSH